MEILFKSDGNVFLRDNKLLYDDNKLYYPEECIQNVPHLDTLPVLFHIRKYGKLLPTFYEYKNMAIVKSIIFDDVFSVIPFEEKDKDFTQVNINKVKDGNII